MKIRTGFVSNSSSSSFLLDTYYLSEYQIEQIKNHIQVAQNMSPEEREQYDIYYYEKTDAWDITINDNRIELFTVIDNFNMEDFLEYIGVPRKAII